MLAISLLELRAGEPGQPTRIAIFGNRSANATMFLVEVSVSLDDVLGAAAAGFRHSDRAWNWADRRNGELR